MPSRESFAYRRGAQLRAMRALEASDSSRIETIYTKAADDFHTFCTLLDKPPAPHMLEWHRELITGESNRYLLDIAGPNTDILSPRGPLPLTTKVATPEGWRELKDIQTGDTIYGDDGLPTVVLSTVEYPASPLFRVTFSDGTSMVCDDSHRFDVRRMGTDKKGTYRTVTLQEIRELVTTGVRGNWRTGVQRTVRKAETGETPWLDTQGHERYQVPVTAAVNYPPLDLPLHPYIIGILLGDGGLTDLNCINITTADKDIADFINTILPEDHVLVERSYESRKYSYQIQLTEGGASNKIIDGRRGGFKKFASFALQQLGMRGKGALDKAIPDIYLRGSIEQREWLLRGLLDSDGSRQGRGKETIGRGGLSFGSSSLQLIRGVEELVRSLGGITRFNKPYYPHYYNNDKKIVSKNLAYRISISLPEDIKPFLCERKRRQYLGPASARSNRGCVRSIVNIEPEGVGEVKCLTVSNEQERFLIEDYVVSKNSAKSTVLNLFTAWCIGRHTVAKRPLQIIYVSYNIATAIPKSRIIKQIVDNPTFRKVFPNCRLKPGMQSDIGWSVDFDYAGIPRVGDEEFTLRAAGLRGSITSKRAHLCLTGEATVLTDQGQQLISTLFDAPNKCRIGVCNTETKKLEWASVAAVTRRRVSTTLTLKTADGPVIRCTPEHPFLVEGYAYVSAEELKVGDILIGATDELLEEEQFVGSVEVYQGEPVRVKRRKQVCEAEHKSWTTFKLSEIIKDDETPHYVYDLEVAHKDHNFIANRLIVSNCIVDDPIKSSTDIRNPAIREEQNSNWSSVIAPIIFEGGRSICLGTRFHPLDIHKTMFIPDKGWKQVVQEALTYDDKGEPKSYWPSQWSVDYLLQQKELDPVAFCFQYQQQPVATSDLVVSPELLIKGDVATEFDSLALGIDLSASKNETSDYTAFVLGGRLKDKYYIIDAHQCRSIGNLEKIDLLCDMLLEWGILTLYNGEYQPTYSTVTLVVESVAYQASLAADLRRVLLNERGLSNLHIHEVKGFRGDKIARFRGTLGLLENKKVTFNKFRKFDALFDQLINVGATAHDDMLDAYTWLITFLQRRGNFSIEY